MVGVSIYECRHRARAEAGGQLRMLVLTFHLLRQSLWFVVTAHAKLAGQRTSWASTVFKLQSLQRSARITEYEILHLNMSPGHLNSGLHICMLRALFQSNCLILQGCVTIKVVLLRELVLCGGDT